MFLFHISLFFNSLFIVFFIFCGVSFNSYALPVTPDEIAIPNQLNKRSAEQIQTVFSSLEKQHQQKTANLWYLNYKKALLLKYKDDKVFCQIMKELSEQPAFPLKDLALIQSYEVCPLPEGLSFEPEKQAKWLRLRLAESFYKRRKFFENPEQTLSSTIYLAKHSAYKELKVSYLKHALDLDKKQKGENTKELSSLLYRLAPHLNPKPLLKDYLSVAEGFKKDRNFKKAKGFYIKILNAPNSSFEEKHASFKGLDRIYKIQRNNKKQIKTSLQWSQWLLKENTEQSLIKYYKRQLAIAQQQWNVNENQKAIQTITDILKDSKSKVIKEEALYLRGLIYIQEKQFEQSLVDWKTAITTLNQKRKPQLLEKILWKKAWLLRREKKYAPALVNLRKLEKLSQNPYTQYKILFWKGKTLKNLGHNFLAKKHFKHLIEQDIFGYYGLLARKMLNKEMKIKKTEDTYKQFSYLKDETDSNLIHWLILFDESELLSYFLAEKEDQLLKQTKHTEQDWLKIIWLWLKAKKYLDVFQSLEKMSADIKSIFLKNHISLLFPLDFSEEVTKASQKWKVPKALIFAIIRQESAFNKRARSQADAFGLMQLIPSTARQTAKQIKVPYRNFKDLYRPTKNITLGTAYLQKLLKQYNNRFLLAVSAYNAGGTPVNQWKENMKNLDSLEFIENIPYEETRTYVRLVMRNYIFYHNELNEGGDWFPDWLLK